MKVYRERFSLKNDLSTYRIKYKCSYDCHFGGCPGHIAEFTYHGNSDIYSITWCTGEIGEYTTSFNETQFALIEDFMKRLKE